MKLDRLLTLIMTTLLITSMNAQNNLIPPSNLQTGVIETNVELTWSPPDTTNGFYLNWDNGNTGYAIGLNEGGYYAVAARWDAAQLTPFMEYSIEKIAFFLTGVDSDYAARIWTGSNADSIVFGQNISAVNGGWTHITLNNPMPLSNLEDLWVGYEVSQPEFEFPAGTDNGPAIAGYGDMLNMSGTWESISTVYNLDLNFNIRVYLTGNGESILLSKSKLPAADLYQSKGNPIVASGFQSASIKSPSVFEEVTGYNVYRDEEQIASLPSTDLTFTDENLELGFYTYGVTAVYPSGESLPALASVQLGVSQLLVEPDSIIDTLVIGQPYSKIITLNNSGSTDLSWLFYSNSNWMYGYPQVGFLQPGELIDVEVTVFSNDLVAGENNGELSIFDVNFFEPLVTIPVSIFAIGAPSISVTPEELNFGDVPYGNAVNKILSIHNYGSDTLQLESIVSSNPEFSLEGIENFIAPYGQLEINVSLTANILGENFGTIAITSNDALNPEINVPVFANVYLQPPAYVQATMDDSDVTLNWGMAINGSGEWFHYDSGENLSALGVTGGGTWQYAARWDASDLNNYAGHLVPKVSFFPRSAETQYTLKVWQGENAEITILSQPVTFFQTDAWNEVIIQNPFNIDATQDLWVGFEVTQPDSAFPAGVDAGPAIIDKGDMLNIGEGWQSAAIIYGLDFNWNLQIFVLNDDSTFQSITNSSGIQENSKINISGSPVLGDLKPGYQSTGSMKSVQAELLGYNVYRDDVLLNNTLLSEETYFDPDLAFGLYEYGISAVYDEGESPTINTFVQIGAPEIVFNPTSISDTLENGASADHIVMIYNTGDFTMEWSAYAYASWIFVSDSSGTVEPGDSTQIVVALSSAALFGGSYNSAVSFEINNLNYPTASLPVFLEVSGSAQLVIIPDSVDFGMTAIGTTKTAYVSLLNLGNDFIFIEDMMASPEVFSTMSFPFFLYPGGIVTFPVYFSPMDPGEFTGNLIITTDDPSNPEYAVPLSGNSLLPMPMNFTSEIDSNNVILDWQSPLGGNGDYLQYSENTSSTAIGYTEGGTFMVAAKFGPEELMMFNGGSLSQLGFIPWTVNAQFTAKVWMGENAETLLISQPVDSIIPYEWNEIILESSIAIDTAQFLWIGYEVTHEPGEFPAGVDWGPAIDGFGNLISIDGIEWTPLSYYGLDMNWNLRGLVDQNNKAIAMNPAIQGSTTKYNNSGSIKAAFEVQPQNLKYSPMTLELLGYNVYRNGSLLNDSLLVQETEYIDFDLESGLYSYEVTAVYNLGESQPAGPLEVSIEPAVMSPVGWNHHTTSMTHVIHIPTQAEASGFMTQGDWIGVFYDDNGIMKCGGSLMWAESDSLKLIVYGDDPSTSLKEGFDFGEWLNWKVFMSDTEEEFDIVVDYNTMMPNYDGNFHMLGISALTSMQLITTGFEENIADQILIYPNPSTGYFTVKGSKDFSVIKVYNSNGSVVLEKRLTGENETIVNLNAPSGLYYIMLQGKDNVEIKKFILQH